MAPLKLGLSLLVFLAGGCASFMRLDSARTAGKGRHQVMLAPSIYLNQRESPVAGVNVDVLWRYGLTDRVDLGLRAHLDGIQADVKVALRRSTDPTRGVDLAFAPSVGVGHDINWAPGQAGDPPPTGELCLPLIVGINLGGQELVLSPQILYQRVSTLPAGALNAGITVAFGTIERPGFRIYPVIAVWKALDPDDLFGASLQHGDLVIQPALVWRWGS